MLILFFIIHLGIIDRETDSSLTESLSVVIGQTKSDTSSLLICKGSENLKGKLILDLEESETFDSIVKGFHSKGLKVIVYGRKFLSSPETSEFERQYKSITTSLIPQYQKLDALGDEIESRMTLLAIIGKNNKLKFNNFTN